MPRKHLMAHGASTDDLKDALARAVTEFGIEGVEVRAGVQVFQTLARHPHVWLSGVGVVPVVVDADLYDWDVVVEKDDEA